MAGLLGSQVGRHLYGLPLWQHDWGVQAANGGKEQVALSAAAAILRAASLCITATLMASTLQASAPWCDSGLHKSCSQAAAPSLPCLSPIEPDKLRDGPCRLLHSWWLLHCTEELRVAALLPLAILSSLEPVTLHPGLLQLSLVV